MNIHVSIASGNTLKLFEELLFIDAEYGRLHVDIEDGNFVSNITFGVKTLQAICRYSKSMISVHMMVNQPENYIPVLKVCKPGIVFLHFEDTRYPQERMAAFERENIKIGLAINPFTPLRDMQYILNRFTDIMILTSEPDGFGQQYIVSIEEKIKELRRIWKGSIWVDGGIQFPMIEHLSGLGVTEIIMGRAIFSKHQRNG